MLWLLIRDIKMAPNRLNFIILVSLLLEVAHCWGSSACEEGIPFPSFALYRNGQVLEWVAIYSACHWILSDQILNVWPISCYN